MKKFIAILCAAAMVLTLAACGAKRNTEYAGQTVTGKVTAIDGTSVTPGTGRVVRLWRTLRRRRTAAAGNARWQQPDRRPAHRHAAGEA